MRLLTLTAGPRTNPLSVNGGTAVVTIPSDIAPGNYLIRHEIIALHLAITEGGAEFYPSCTQIAISGNGSGRPKSEELVSFPGAYKDDDPGIFFPEVYTMFKLDGRRLLITTTDIQYECNIYLPRPRDRFIRFTIF